MMSFSERGLPPDTKAAANHLRRKSRVVVTGCLLALLLSLPGCNQSEDAAPGETGATSTDNADVSSEGGGDASGARCTDLVASAVDMMQPDRLGITADSATAVDLINTWNGSCGRDLVDLTDSLEQATSLITAAAGTEGLKRVRQPRFDDQDIRHIRDSLMMKQTVEAVIQGSTSETQRIVRLFDYTCRAIALEDGDESRLPLTPWHTLLFGRGTSRDRAWVFSLLLRQLKTDAVILTPATAADDAEAAEPPQDGETTVKAAPWLVGVLSEGRVLLFSPLLGLPVPSADDSPRSVSVTTPATLREVREQPELLARLYGDSAASGLASAAPGALRVQVISCTSLWSARMASLQTQLSGNQALVVFDGLTDNPLGDGLLQRVRQGGQDLWTDENVSIWNWPEQQQTAFAGILDDDRQLQRMLVREFPFRAPVRVRADEERKQLVFDPTYTQLKTRVRQLLGDQAQAIRSFLTIRLSERFNPRLTVPTEISNMHLQAAEDACFWVAFGQFEQGFAETAIESLELYLRKYPEGDWRDQSIWLLAQSLAARGQFDKAVQRAGELSDDYPQQPGVAFLTARWQALAGGDGKPADPAPAATPGKPPANDSPVDPPASGPREPVVAPRPPRPAETPSSSD